MKLHSHSLHECSSLQEATLPLFALHIHYLQQQSTIPSLKYHLDNAAGKIQYCILQKKNLLKQNISTFFTQRQANIRKEYKRKFLCPMAFIANNAIHVPVAFQFKRELRQRECTKDFSRNTYKLPMEINALACQSTTFSVSYIAHSIITILKEKATISYTT